MIKRIIKKIKRGEIKLAVLDALEDGVTEIADLFIAFLNAGYGASLGQIQREKSRLESLNIDARIEREAKRKFSKIIYSLKQDGLIREEKRKGIKTFLLTTQGNKKREKLRKRIKALPYLDYPKPTGSSIILISYDVPEKERHKRDWTRRAMDALGFQPVHESVFVGKGRLPKRFLDDLYELRLMGHLEIMEISKKGTLRKMSL